MSLKNRTQHIQNMNSTCVALFDMPLIEYIKTGQDLASLQNINDQLEQLFESTPDEHQRYHNICTTLEDNFDEDIPF